jgi:hypothetical protein
MKKFILGGLLLPFLFTACWNTDAPGVDGLWQLKTIRTANQITPVDTIYYSFMLKRYEFSYIVLHDQSPEPEQASTVYGYVDFPTKDKIHIRMDEYHGETSELLWNDDEVSYNILKLTAKEMVLEDNATQYYFIKF